LDCRHHRRVAKINDPGQQSEWLASVERERPGIVVLRRMSDTDRHSVGIAGSCARLRRNL
jgi:hypothetical protein